MLFDTVPAHSFPHSKKCELEKIDKLYNPGPGKYDPKLYTFTKLPTWKIGTTKRKVFTVLEEYPGPGTYSIPVEITNGPKYSMSTKAGLKESKEKFLNPGPAHYKPLFSKSQKYFYTFGLKTIIKDRDKTPGPGNYDLRKEKDLIIPSYLFGKEKREDEIVKRRKKYRGLENMNFVLILFVFISLYILLENKQRVEIIVILPQDLALTVIKNL